MFNFNFQQKDVKKIIKSSSYTNKDPNRNGAGGLQGASYKKQITKPAKTSVAAPVYNFSGLRQVGNLYGVVVCVNYSDFFKYSLESAVGHFKKVFVITDNSDTATADLCSKYDFVELIKTDKFYEGGRKFDKGAGINLGLNKVPVDQANWCLVFDADIVFPKFMSKYLCSKALDTTVLFGAPRHFLRDINSWKNFVSGNSSVSSISEVYNPGPTPIGYFQLFNSQNLLLPKMRYPEGHDDASSSDLIFTKRFDTKTTLKHVAVIHLGDDGKNWKGRVTPLFKKKAPVKSLAELYPNTNPADRVTAQRYSQGPLVELQNKLAPKDFDLSSIVHPSATKSKDLAVMCCYFSSVRFKNPVNNYYIFKKFIEQHVDLYTIELVFDGEEPQLGADSFYKKTLRGSRADNLLWQKERLLNILAEDILSKTDYKYLGWADADVLFQNENWDKSVCDVLEDHLVAQMFDSAALLSPDLTIKELPEEYFGLPQRYLSTIKAWEAEGASTSKPLNLAGPPATQCGFAWAACREFFETTGLEDRNAFGDSDSFMIAAFTCGEPFFNVHQMHCMGPSTVSEFTAYKKKIRDLASSLNKKVLSCAEGSLYHLQHGSLKGKQYCSRLDMIREAKYDALKHIELDKNGLWKISASASPLLKKHLTTYFNAREEDQFLNNYDVLHSYEL